MAEYISKEAVISNLIEQIEKYRNTAECETTELVIKRFADYIASFPAANVQPVIMTEKELDNITSWLKWHIFRNMEVMYAEDPETEQGERYYDLIDMVASLHNLLYEVINGERYDYWFHWCNKIGSDCNENFFDDIMKKENEDNE